MVTIDLMSDIDCVTETFTLVLETFNVFGIYTIHSPVQRTNRLARTGAAGLSLLRLSFWSCDFSPCLLTKYKKCRKTKVPTMSINRVDT